MGFLSNFLDAIRLNDDADFDDYDEYEDYVAEERNKESKKAAKKAQKQRELEAYEEDEVDEEEYAPRRSATRATSLFSRSNEKTAATRESYSSVAARANANRLQNGTSMNSTSASAQPMSSAAGQRTTNKVVSLNRATAPSRASLSEVNISKPSSIEDAQDISDMLMAGKPIIVNLEGLDISKAQRIMDFVSGCVYTLDGKLLQISGYIFILSPKDVDVSGDYLALLKQDGFGVPTFSR